MKRLILISCVMTIAVMSLSAQSAKKKAEIDNIIRGVMSEQTEAWNRGDLEGFMKGYWRSDELVFVSTNVTRGWQKTLDNYKRSYPSRTAMGTLTFSDLEITVISNDAALVVGSWSLAREKDNPRGKFTLLFRKIDKNWLIVHDHSS